MSDQKTPHGARPEQSPPLDLSIIRNTKSIANAGLVIAVIALLVSGVLYFRMKSVVISHTDGLTQKVATVEESNSQLMDDVQGLQGTVDSMGQDLAALKDELPKMVQQQMILNALNEMQHRAGYLSANMDSEEDKQKVVEIIAMLAELQGKQPPATPEEPEAKPEPSAEEVAEAAKKAVAEQMDAAGDVPAEAAPAEKAAAVEKPETPEGYDEVEPQRPSDAQLAPKDQAEPDAHAEVPAESEDKAAEPAAAAPEKDKEAEPAAESAAEPAEDAKAPEAEEQKKAEKADAAAAEPQGDTLEAEAEDAAYKTDAAGAKALHEDVHKLVSRLHEVFGRLENYVAAAGPASDADTAAKAEPAAKSAAKPAEDKAAPAAKEGEKEPVEPDAPAAEEKSDAAAAPELTPAMDSINALAEQLSGMKIHASEAAAPAEKQDDTAEEKPAAKDKSHGDKAKEGDAHK